MRKEGKVGQKMNKFEGEGWGVVNKKVKKQMRKNARNENIIKNKRHKR